MEQIITNLLCADNKLIKQATAELHEAYKRPETVPELCDLVVSHKKSQVRQYAAVLLRKRLAKMRHWQMVAPEQQQIIKQGMLNALVAEPEKSVRTAIAQLIGALVRNEADKPNSWMTDVLKFVYNLCSSPDPKQSELGSILFATLVDAAPDQFVPHMETVCEMFSAAIMATEASGNMATPVMFNLLMGMSYLAPFVLGNNTAEHTYQKSIPSVIKSLRAFAVLPEPTQFIRAFDILEGMADYTPKLLTNNIKLLMEFCLETATNLQLDNAVRIKTISYAGWLVRLKKKLLIKQKLIEPIIHVLFNLMSTEPENEDEDDEYFVGDESKSPVTAATQTMDLLALNVPPEKLIPPLLQLLESALQGQDPLPKRAAYLSMAVIAEGCSEAICHKYLEVMLNTVKMGIKDPTPFVRNAAFFALGQFSEHLQPDITKFAPEIMPILFEFLQQLCNELRIGGAEPKHIDRMFYALETFCEHLEKALVPHLPMLMERLLEAMNPNNSVHVRELTLSAISCAVSAAREDMMPYFQQLIAMLQIYFAKTDNEDILTLRPQAIDTLAAIARTIGKQIFMPLATDTINFALSLLAESNDADPDVRRSLYNLFAGMADVLNEEMSSVLPKIMERIYESVLRSEEILPEYKEDIVNMPASESDSDDRDIDIENSDGEEDDEDDHRNGNCSVENAYLDEKEQAILALKEIAEYTGEAFMPYIEQSFQNVYKVIDHPHEDIRRAVVDTLCSFTIAWHKHNKGQVGAINAINILVPKMVHFVNDDEEPSVVIGILDSFIVMLKSLKHEALPTDDLREDVFNCIHNILLGKIACQFDEPTISAGGGDEETEESEYVEALIESAGNLLPVFGEAMQPQQFAMYFGRVYPVFLDKLLKAKNNEDFESRRASIYGALAECFAPLQKYSATYFDALCPLLIQGMQDECNQVRQNAVFGLGELVLHAEEKSFEAYPEILMALSNAISKESEQSALDNICGAIARLIITNCNLVPLDQVLPIFLQHLPLSEDINENTSIFKCFKLLFIQARNHIVAYLEQILAIAIHVLYKKEYEDEETCENALNIVKEIRDNYPDKFNAVANSNPEILQFLQTM